MAARTLAALPIAAAATLVVLIALAAPARAGEPVTVFAAASVTDSLEAVAAAYVERGGAAPRFSFAASSTLARQVEAGAPADIVVSASRAWMDYLEARGLIDAASRTDLTGNALVLIAPPGAAPGPVSLDGPGAILGRLGTEGRLVVGDTAHVPAGIYATQALGSLGLWPALEPRLALADNVRAALALVARGEAPLGIVYATDAAVAPEVRVVARFPADSHAPIVYHAAVVAERGTPEVRRLFDFLRGPKALAIFERFGFTPAGG